MTVHSDDCSSESSASGGRRSRAGPAGVVAFQDHPPRKRKLRRRSADNVVLPASVSSAQEPQQDAAGGENGTASFAPHAATWVRNLLHTQQPRELGGLTSSHESPYRLYQEQFQQTNVMMPQPQQVQQLITSLYLSGFSFNPPCYHLSNRAQTCTPSSTQTISFTRSRTTIDETDAAEVAWDRSTFTRPSCDGMSSLANNSSDASTPGATVSQKIPCRARGMPTEHDIQASFSCLTASLLREQPLAPVIPSAAAAAAAA